MSLHEECGIFGIYNTDGGCAGTVYNGLFALQHRGQEAAGIAAVNNRELSVVKNVGLVGEVFKETDLVSLNGTMAIGHVRYPTAGMRGRENAQPLAVNHIKGTLAIAHNGSLVNYKELRRDREYKGAMFHTTCDSEIIAYLIAQERLNCDSIEVAVLNAMKYLRGAYSLVIMSARKLLAVRDPFGIRPLCIGKLGDAFIFASESCALDAVGAEFVRDVLPGEIVWVFENEMHSIRMNDVPPSRLCIFEHIYFARIDSVIDGQSVYDSRLRIGKALAHEYPINADVVIGVPDSGLVSAKGYAMESNIPYQDGIVMNRYVGRTFIAPGQSARETLVRMKLNPLRATVAGKRVVVLDDSIVRGTTTKQIIHLLREAGAVEIHLLLASPKFISPCYYGADVPDKEHLIAAHHTTEEIAEIIDADSVGFLSVASLNNIAPQSKCGFCDACFTEDYPVL